MKRMRLRSAATALSVLLYCQGLLGFAALASALMRHQADPVEPAPAAPVEIVWVDTLVR